ncbi:MULTISPECIES: hypothetical protein [Pseudomonas syringae group]|uniref:Uncharacterized protein n=2 Tax=Pseudomonas syringae group TaxID=136849 RepID=A0A0P9QTU5_PSESG|nr:MULTISPECIES: hypothetical protein [Pseudomonas syringae group]EFW82183.1 hypothetical protein PsgB076_03085 [Pseudomonas savastanoi pv. glycinea str. B076]KPC26599.1 Uncharacterized protein AC498_4566 [Pseudomonas savastanoi pv. glycinea]KPC35155.1 Uncharacterized protein AC497_5043 [Pseudomonas savastanoi pv. glycinea]KPC45372.1 Uncharacterized protein AC496_0837 [Pseudomonas savastanoi pv. glycinea]KPX18514.1 hypothetical protein ALO73_200068 [Pseudomonas syringae pv. daphniphylli]
MTGVKNRAFCVRLLVEMKLLSVVLHQQAALSELFIRQSKKRPLRGSAGERNLHIGEPTPR